MLVCTQTARDLSISLFLSLSLSHVRALQQAPSASQAATLSPVHDRISMRALRKSNACDSRLMLRT